MVKKNTSPTSDLIGFRPKPEDKAAVQFIQEELSVSGMKVNTTDAISGFFLFLFIVLWVLAGPPG